MKKVCYALILVLFCFGLQAQETAIPIIKPEVDDSQVMFKRTVWRRMNMKEKQNRAFYSKNGELCKLILQGVEDGLIKPYATDSCINLMSDEQFQSNTTLERAGGGFGGFDSGFGGGFGDESTSSQDSGPKFDPIPKDLFYIAYIKEDVIFDRNRSRLYWYIRSISLAIPATETAFNPAGFEKIVAHFKYQDVVDLVRGPYADEAIWYNNQNQAQHRNMGDAFELRLFAAPIIKVSNADNLDIRQITSDPFDAILLQQKYEYDLMEYESSLWEY